MIQFTICFVFEPIYQRLQEHSIACIVKPFGFMHYFLLGISLISCFCGFCMVRLPYLFSDLILNLLILSSHFVFEWTFFVYDHFSFQDKLAKTEMNCIFLGYAFFEDGTNASLRQVIFDRSQGINPWSYEQQTRTMLLKCISSNGQYPPRN